MFIVEWSISIEMIKSSRRKFFFKLNLSLVFEKIKKINTLIQGDIWFKKIKSKPFFYKRGVLRIKILILFDVGNLVRNS